MMRLTHFLFAAIAALLAGCAAVQPVKNQTTPVTGSQVTYVFEGRPDMSLMTFGDYKRSRRGDGYVENRGIRTTKSDRNLLVTKFVDNGLAGSVNEYNISYAVDGNNLVLAPAENRIHQDGLVLPKPVPAFQLSEVMNFLSSSRHELTFEVDSKYPSEAVNANFKRLLSQQSLSSFNSGNEKIFENTYFLEVDGAESKIEVKTYPYRDGSKCTVSVIYVTKATPTNTIVLPEVERRIRDRVVSIVNS